MDEVLDSLWFWNGWRFDMDELIIGSVDLVVLICDDVVM